MSVHECCVPIPSKAVSLIDEIIVEREVSQWMVVEKPAIGGAWLTGYFVNREAAAAWSALAPFVKSQLE